MLGAVSLCIAVSFTSPSHNDTTHPRNHSRGYCDEPYYHIGYLPSMSCIGRRCAHAVAHLTLTIVISMACE